MKMRMRMRSALNLLSLLCLSTAQQKWTPDFSDWNHRDKATGLRCSNLTLVLDNWKYAIMHQVKDMLTNDHASILPDYVRIQPLSEAVRDLYKQFNTLKENLAELSSRFDKVESLVDDIQARKVSKPKLRVPHQRGSANASSKALWVLRMRARRGPGA